MLEMEHSRDELDSSGKVSIEKEKEENNIIRMTRTIIKNMNE